MRDQALWRRLLDRLRSRLRERAGVAPQGAVLHAADVIIDASTWTVLKGGTDIRPTRKEFDRIWPLASNAKRLVTWGMALAHA